MCAAVIARVDASPIFQLAKHVLDFMPAFVDGFVVGYLDFAVSLCWDAGFDAALFERVPEPVRIVTLVSQKF